LVVRGYYDSFGMGPVVIGGAAFADLVAETVAETAEIAEALWAPSLATPRPADLAVGAQRSRRAPKRERPRTRTVSGPLAVERSKRNQAARACSARRTFLPPVVIL
jgi:hypothetical protein